MNAEMVIGLTCVVVLMPLVSAMIAGSIAAGYRWVTPLVSSFLLLVSSISAMIVFSQQWNEAPLLMQWDWFTLGDHPLKAGIFINNATLVLLVVVSCISLFVHVFSMGYMADDKDLHRYFGMLGFFTFTMLGLVLADNLFLLFIFWELVGFSSYTLIGHWREKPAAPAAAKKAFIINRVSDLGFIVGLLIIWTNTHNLTFTSFDLTGTEAWRFAASLCFLIGVIGKSAQFPLFNWLPSAMEGPTPVSALIHAATMVVAGVFLLIRLFPLFTPEALDVVTIIGCITALLGAMAALRQFDLKKILAYSTISQLGMMVAALGSGSYGIALLHLFTHAFFKAGLFLAAGSVLHAVHQAQHHAHVSFDAQDIRLLGGLRKVMPITSIGFMICSAALMGLPLTTGFLSKDAIMVSLFHWAGNDWKILFPWAMVLTVVLTIFYTVRMVQAVFLAAPQKTALLTIHESPVIIRIPVILLAAASGWLLVDINPLEYNGWLLKGVQLSPAHNSLITWLSLILIPLGILAAWQWYTKNSYKLLADSKPNILSEGFYLNTINEKLIRKPVDALSVFILKMDKQVLDTTLHTVAYIQITISHFIGWIDRMVVDGFFVSGTATIARTTGAIARSFSGGKIQTYIFWSVFALVIFLIWTLILR